MLRIGLIGCGRIGRVHADSITVHPRATLARVYDPIEAAAREIGARFDAEWTTDMDAIIDDDTIDAVVVASPTPTHVDLLTRSVEAGKAVLCEKPIDLDLGRVDACASRLGDLFRDMTIHDFDLARFVLGEVVEVTATGSNLISPEIAQAGDIDGGVVLLRGVSGALCSITNSRRCAFGYDQRLEAFGELGMLSAANQLPTSVRFSGADRTEVAAPYFNFFLDRYPPAYRAELDHFVTAVETGTIASPGFADGRAALVLADAANESLRTGTTVRIP